MSFFLHAAGLRLLRTPCNSSPVLAGQPGGSWKSTRTHVHVRLPKDIPQEPRDGVGTMCGTLQADRTPSRRPAGRPSRLRVHTRRVSLAHPKDAAGRRARGPNWGLAASRSIPGGGERGAGSMTDPAGVQILSGARPPRMRENGSAVD